MHVFLYEFVTGGGLVEAGGTLPPTLLREAKAMVAALAKDLSAIPNCRVTMLRDGRILDLPHVPGEIVEIQSSFDERERVEEYSADADATVVIAPEFDALLAQRVGWVEYAGGRLVSPASDVVAVAADKQRTIERLDAAGVPTPQGVSLDADEPLPSDFPFPAVLKPRCGAGSQDTHLLAEHTDDAPPYAWPRRLEQYCRGMPTSVALLCGPNGRYPLAPCRQTLSDDGRLVYEGGTLPLPPSLAERAATLAVAAVEPLGTPVGYIGVDIILGNDPDGSEDVVIEVNPRLTTSYVGLRASAEHNLAQAMLDVADGNSPRLSFSDRLIEFAADGTVWHAGRR